VEHRAAPTPGAAAPLPAVVHRQLFEAYPDALVVADAAGLIVLANPAAHALLGYPEGELVGERIDALVPQALRERHAAHRAGYARSPRPRPMGIEMDLVALRRDGSQVAVEIALSPLHADGAALVVAAIRDVGAYPRVRQALLRARYSEQLAQLGRLAVDARDPQLLLRELPERVAQTLQTDAVAVYMLEPDRRMLRVVGAFGGVGGLGEGLRVPNRADTFAGYVVAQPAAVDVADFRGERRFTVPAAWLDAGWTSALGVALSDRGRPIGVLTVASREKTRFGDDERRFVESLANLLAASVQRTQSQEALRHAQRLESVGQLTGGIAHDFNNLLTVIQGNLQVLGELPALAGDEQARPLVAAATRAARRGAELTGKLLAFSRRQVLQPSVLDVGAMLHSLADMLRRTLDQRIGIAVDVPVQPLMVRADAGQLESALLNIAINARDAMPDGGSLRFGASACAALPDALREEIDAAAAPAGHVAISIGDNGTGMSEAVKARAFEPFFTTKESGRGTGLGLSTVYGFVKQSKGAVVIDSRPGVGTTLTLYMPQAPGPTRVESPPPHAASAGAPRGVAGLRVLLVEDDADVRAVMHDFLVTLGCQVRALPDGEQALPLLGAGAAVDVLVTDIALGAGMRGTRLAERAQQQLPSLAVLLMSGYPAELLAADAQAPSHWELLRKPCTREELAQAMARVTHR